MKLESKSFENNGALPAKLAFGKPHPENHMELAGNRNPHLAWSDAPQGTKSFAVVCYDSDVPTKFDDVNQQGKSLPKDMPRMDFYHWALVDVPATLSELAEGQFSEGVKPGGKDGPEAPDGMRQGINNFTMAFQADPNMKGDYYGYDGPCPPWNDELLHHYHFVVYALDVEKCPVEGSFGAQELPKAIEGHVLGQASITGTYSLNPSVQG